jgi:phage shock protein C
MSTRTRSSRSSDAHSADTDFDADDLFTRDRPSYESAFGLDDDITDDDIADFLYAKEAEEEKPGFWNLPTVAGLSTIGVGSAYLLQELGLFASGFDFSALVGPWLIGVLIILIGFGVLSWSPDRKRRKKKQREEAARRRARQREARRERRRTEGRSTSRRQERREERKERKADRRARYTARKSKFVRSRTNRKLLGVCGGIGEAFGVDPTLVRIAFVIALVASGGVPVVPLYFLFAWLMPDGRSASSISDKDLHRLDDDDLIVIR